MELKEPPRAFIYLLGVADFAILQGLYADQEAKSGSLSLDLARGVLKSFEDYIFFSLDSVYLHLESLPSGQIVVYEELEFWVKIAYLYHIKETGASQSSILELAQDLIGKSLPIQQIVSTVMASSENPLQSIYQEALVSQNTLWKKSEFFNQDAFKASENHDIRVEYNYYHCEDHGSYENTPGHFENRKDFSYSRVKKSTQRATKDSALKPTFSQNREVISYQYEFENENENGKEFNVATEDRQKFDIISEQFDETSLKDSTGAYQRNLNSGKFRAGKEIKPPKAAKGKYQYQQIKQPDSHEFTHEIHYKESNLSEMGREEFYQNLEKLKLSPKEQLRTDIKDSSTIHMKENYYEEKKNSSPSEFVKEEFYDSHEPRTQKDDYQDSVNHQAREFTDEEFENSQNSKHFEDLKGSYEIKKIKKNYDDRIKEQTDLVQKPVYPKTPGPRGKNDSSNSQPLNSDRNIEEIKSRKEFIKRQITRSPTNIKPTMPNINPQIRHFRSFEEIPFTKNTGSPRPYLKNIETRRYSPRMKMSSPKPPVANKSSPFKAFISHMQSWLSFSSDKKLPSYKTILHHLHKLIQQYESALPNAIDYSGLSEAFILTLKRYYELVRSASTSEFAILEIPAHYILLLLKETYEIILKSEWFSHASQIELLANKLEPIIQKSYQEKQSLVSNFYIVVMTLEASLSKLEGPSEGESSIIFAILELCSSIENRPKKPDLKINTSSLYHQLKESIAMLEFLKTQLKKLGEKSYILENFLSSLWKFFGQLSHISNMEHWSPKQLAVHLPGAVAQHIKVYEALLDSHKDLVLGPLREMSSKWSEYPISVLIPNDAPTSFKSALQYSLREFKNIRKRLLHNGESTSDCDIVIKIFRDALETPVWPREQFRASTMEACQAGLSDIFKFYVKQISLADRASSPRQAGEHNSYLKIGKFLSFCRDFGIFKQGFVSENQVSKIFFENSDHHRRMRNDQFLIAIDQLAQIYFDIKYDTHYGHSVSTLGYIDKVRLMYKFLECDDPIKYGLKMKGYGNPYYMGSIRRSPEYYPRIRRILKSNSPRQLRHPHRWRI